MEQLKFHLLDCVAGQPCSQVFGIPPYSSCNQPSSYLATSFSGHLFPQAIPGDPEFSHVEKGGEVKYRLQPVQIKSTAM